MKTDKECSAILAKGNPKPGDMDGCAMGQGGVFISGGEGDDQVFIAGDHKGERIVIDGGPGKDKVFRTKNDVGLLGAAAVEQGGVPIAAILLLAALALVVIAIAIRAFRPDLRGGGGGRP